MASAAPFAPLPFRACLLVRAAVLGGPDARAAWDEWFTDVVLDDLPYEEARLLPQVFANLSTNGGAAVLPPRIRGKYRWVWASNQLRCDAVAPVLRALRESSIPTVLLKGAALLASGRCAWGAREMGDVDVLVPSERTAEAARVLGAAGWTALSRLSPDCISRRLVVRRHSWNYDSGSPHGQLDLHWHVFEGRGVDVDSALWSRTEPVGFGAVEVLRLDDTDQLLHTIEHAAHGEPAHRLTWVTDVAHQLDQVDPDVLAARARALGVRDLVAEALAVVALSLETPSAKRVAARVAAVTSTRREQVLAGTETDRDPGPRRSRELVRTALVQGADLRRPVRSMGIVLRRRIEPSLCAHPLLSTAFALMGRPRKAQVAALRWLGPFARPPRLEQLADGAWVDLRTGDGLDSVAGPGWGWPMPHGVWSDGVEARLALDTMIPRGRPLVLEVVFGDDAEHTQNPRIAVTVNGRPVCQWTFRAGPEHAPTQIRIPAWLGDWCRPIDVAFRVLPPRAPRVPWERGDLTRGLQLRAVRVATDVEDTPTR